MYAWWLFSHHERVFLPLTKISQMARPYYGDTAYAYPDAITELFTVISGLLV